MMAPFWLQSIENILITIWQVSFFNRTCPPRKDRPVLIDLPDINNSEGASRVMAGILEAVSDGDITPDEASGVATPVEVYRKTLDTSELEGRLQALEQAKG